MANEVIAAAEEGGLGGVGIAFLGFQQSGEGERVFQGFESGGAAVGGVGERVIDGFLQQGGDARGVTHAPKFARLELKFWQKAADAWAMEVEEELHERSGGVALDVVRNGGVE